MLSKTLQKQFMPLILTGPSGVGKSCFINKLLQTYQNDFEHSISHTTRSIRGQEINGKDYHFISKEEFQQLIKDNKMIEYQKVHHNFYGTSFNELERIIQMGKHPVMDIDIKGAMVLKASEAFRNAKFWFIQPPSLKVLEERLRKRQTDGEEQIRVRLNNASQEMEMARTSGLYTKEDYITNDQLEESMETFLNKVKKEYN